MVIWDHGSYSASQLFFTSDKSNGDNSSTVVSMSRGDNFFIFKPQVPHDHDEYELETLAKYRIYFGLYPPSYVDLADQETLGNLSVVMNNVPSEKLKPFSLAN